MSLYSLSFAGNATSYISIPNTGGAFNFDTHDDFTIEWYQYQTDSNPFPRIFQIGDYPTTTIGVSIEGGYFFYWINGSPANMTDTGPLPDSSYNNVWAHFAICRNAGNTTVYLNGKKLSSITDTNSYSSTDHLTIGNEKTKSDNAAFGGYMTYFSWMKGIAKYTGDSFTVSNDYPPVTDQTVLLLEADANYGSMAGSVINNSVGTIQFVPPGFGPTPPPTPTPSNPFLNMFKPLYSDNSLVYYKPGSLASCGVGTVRNSATKSRRI